MTINNRFKITGFIGAGKNSQCYITIDTKKKDRKVCIKQYFSIQARNPDYIQYRLQLRQAQFKFMNENGCGFIAEAYDYFSQDGYQFMAMQYFKNWTLKRYIESKQPSKEPKQMMTAPQKARFCQQILKSIAFLHLKGEVQKEYKESVAPNIKVKSIIILDMSDSVNEYGQETIDTFNTFINKLKKSKAYIFITLYLYNSEIKCVCKRTPIQQVPMLTEKEYIPNGSTRLTYVIRLFTIKYLSKDMFNKNK